MAEGSLNGTFGAYLIGVILSSCLFGVTCTQTWYYYTRYSDGIVLKVFVGIIWILEVLHVVFGSHAIYYYVILHYADPAALTKATWSASFSIGITGLTAFLVYLFYARRIYYLSNHNVYLVAAIVIPSFCRLGTSLSVTGYSMHLLDFVLFEHPIMAGIVRASLTLYVVTDLLVAVLLCYFLHRNRTGIKRTDTMINRLMVYSIHNGLVTAVADIFVMAFNIAYPEDLIYLAVYQIVANLYSNSFLATLNARRPAKPDNDDFSTNVNTLNLSAFGAAHDQSSADTEGANMNKRHIDINVTPTVDITPGGADGTPSTNAGSKVVSL